MKHPTSRTWKVEDLEKLRKFVETGASPVRAAVHFKRSLAAVQGKARQEGFPFPDQRDLARAPRSIGIRRPKSARYRDPYAGRRKLIAKCVWGLIAVLCLLLTVQMPS